MVKCKCFGANLPYMIESMMGEVGIEGTKNAIEQHHIQGVGVRATGNYQLLNRDLITKMNKYYSDDLKYLGYEY